MLMGGLGVVVPTSVVILIEDPPESFCKVANLHECWYQVVNYIHIVDNLPSRILSVLHTAMLIDFFLSSEQLVS